MIANISGFRTEEEHESELSADKDLEDVKEPWPAEIGGNLTTNNGGQRGRSVEDERNESDSNTSLMDKECISNCGDNQRLEGGS